MTVMMYDVRTNNYSESIQTFKPRQLSVFLLSLDTNRHHYYNMQDKK